MLSSLFVVVIALGAVTAQTYQGGAYPNTVYQGKPPASNPSAYNPPASNPPAYNQPAPNSPSYKQPSSNAPGYNAPGNAPGYNAPANAPGYNAPANAPGYNAPANAPGYNAPGYNAPANAPGYNAPGYNAPGYNAPASYPQPSYGNGQVYSARNLNAEVDDARQRIGGLEEYVVVLSGVADDVTSKVNIVTAFKEEFLNKIYPGIQYYAKAQDKKIASYRAQIEDLSTLRDAVEELSTKVDEILKTLAINRERRSVIVGALSRLDDVDVDQNIELGKLETLIKSEADRLVEAESKVNNNKVKAAEIFDNLGKAVNVINYEQGESFDVTVSSANPSVVYKFVSSFSAVPELQWGITGANIDDLPGSYDKKADGSYGPQADYKADGSYGGSQASYKDESINGKVTVTANATSAIISLVDNSDGFQISRFRVRVTAYLVDNTYLEYAGKASNYY